jgi:hypothetical protein
MTPVPRRSARKDLLWLGHALQGEPADGGDRRVESLGERGGAQERPGKLLG